MGDIDKRLAEIEGVRIFTPETFRRARETAQLARVAIADLESSWSQCSQTCARLQGECDKAARELKSQRLVIAAKRWAAFQEPESLEDQQSDSRLQAEATEAREQLLSIIHDLPK